jgi:hypothetical protein
MDVNKIIKHYAENKQTLSLPPQVKEWYIYDKKLTEWLSNPSQVYQEICTVDDKCFSSHYWHTISPKLKLKNLKESDTNDTGNDKNEHIFLLNQFYIDGDENRQKEIRKCLMLNVHNKSIDKIYLLNERIYSEEELGIQSDKIIQVNIEKRLQYNDIFDFVEKENLDGYIVLSNSDIFFDKSLENLNQTNFKETKSVFTLLRHEYDEKTSLKNCELFGPRSDSQDTWIFHSNQIPLKEQRKVFKINLGVPSCDNKIIYLWNILGYQCHNEPKFIKCYHYHLIQKRNYDMNTERTIRPWCAIQPKLNSSDVPDNHSYHIISESDNLFQYISKKLEHQQHFIIPRIGGIENNYAQIGAVTNQQKQLHDSHKQYIEKTSQVMKYNAGILIPDMNSIIAYSHLYLEAFHKSDLYLDWEPWGDVYKYIQASHDFVTINFSQQKRVWAFALDIFHNIYSTPWTHALKGKRLLIISPFIKSFKKQIKHREKIYGIDLFPECEFVFLKPPQTQGNCESREFTKELAEFVQEIEDIKDDFDIALCACGGYGNLVCSKIYDMNKSSIYVGGVLQMYFGIYGERWLRERKDVMNLFLNEYWTRPLDEEKPAGHEQIEGNCYW